MRDEELLTAFADGVSELGADERRRVEALLADDPAKRGEVERTRTLLAELRAMPAAGAEPDWQAMERAIRTAVPARAPRRWWRWAMPAIACAAVAAAVILLVVLPGKGAEPVATTTPRPPVMRAPAEPVVEEHTFVYLDGEAIDLGATDAKQVVDALSDDDDEGSDVADRELLGSPDLGWVDDLDNDKLDRLEKILKRK